MNTTTLSKPSMPQDSLPFVHSGLAVLYSPVKGRVVTASTTIERGTVLMVDLPYSLVPAPLVHEPPFSICSNSSCHRRVKRVNASSSASSDKYQTQQTAPISPESEVTHRTNQLKQPVPCSKHCAREILWCSDNCRSKDARRHLSECAWLRTCGAQVQAEESIVEFELLWLLVKIFIRKQLDEQTSTHGKLQHSAEEQRKQKDAVTIQSDEPPMTPQSHFEQRGWDSVWDLAGSPDGFPAEDVARWRKMADIYLVGQIPDVECTTNQAMGLICRLETNSFGLYPGVTGIYPITSREGRGDYYGSGLYPTAAMFNHACCPNVSHQLDEHNRRVFTTNCRILQGEECCISYFDLVEMQDAAVRRYEIRTKWTFDCDCQRCQDDGDEKLPEFLLGLGIDSEDNDDNDDDPQ